MTDTFTVMDNAFSCTDRYRRLPPWLRLRRLQNGRLAHVRSLIRDNDLHTVCSSAACPNRTECWNSGTATFMILGTLCTRSCRFCGVSKGLPRGLDLDEPDRVANAVASLQLKYVVITSVTRDDLADGGSSLFAATIHAIRRQCSGCQIEVLVPDFSGSQPAIGTVLNALPDVLSHNVETVPSLYREVRPKADYGRSLELLHRAREHGAVTKSGIMLGLGETVGEIRSVMHDLHQAGCSILTLGQYLRPGKDHLPVRTYYHPDEFASLRREALGMGFRFVMSGPLVRSSYHAGTIWEETAAGKNNKTTTS